MGRGLSERQRELLEGVRRLWSAGYPLVRVTPPGLPRRTRRSILRSVRGLEKRGLVRLERLPARDSWDRGNRVTFAVDPLASDEILDQAWIGTLQAELPVSEVEVEPELEPRPELSPEVRERVEQLRQRAEEVARMVEELARDDR